MIFLSVPSLQGGKATTLEVSAATSLFEDQLERLVAWSAAA
jgi:hypothetical protein